MLNVYNFLGLYRKLWALHMVEVDLSNLRENAAALGSGAWHLARFGCFLSSLKQLGSRSGRACPISNLLLIYNQQP